MGGRDYVRVIIVSFKFFTKLEGTEFGCVIQFLNYTRNKINLKGNQLKKIQNTGCNSLKIKDQ